MDSSPNFDGRADTPTHQMSKGRCDLEGKREKGRGQGGGGKIGEFKRRKPSKDRAHWGKESARSRGGVT